MVKMISNFNSERILPAMNNQKEQVKEKLDLKITVDQYSGFCFGVVYAIEMAEEILEEFGILYSLGDIVHNDEEINRLKKKGLRIIDHEQMSKLRDVRLLIRAHGEPPSTYKLALENNITLIDASCPVVLKLQNRIQGSFEKSKHVYIYGKHGHAEVMGLLGQTGGNAVVFQSIEELNFSEMPGKIELYSQTTKGRAAFQRIYKELLANGIEVELHDTICRQVSNRDDELRIFSSQFDVVLFVSGKKSSNGQVLYEVCKRINSRTQFISSSNDLQRDWFSKNETVGICGATSTPMWLMEEIKSKLSQF